MDSTGYSRATHFSIVWGVTLAVLTLLEWHSLDRDPVKQEIFSPFIERTMAVSVEEAAAPDADPTAGIDGQASPDAVLRYDVEINFNGPLFLAFFFTPMLIFQGIGMAWNRLRRD
ncbi:MAG: hypothetical protein OEW92_04035 [Gammaproteobacteria bacterium]|jgi:hypothetical protein|nr:hypothetical protein [Gammaproteobacteria bacterium]MDH5171565.1 hypothetical protein [Gammaproteobacteria bacterium]